MWSAGASLYEAGANKFMFNPVDNRKCETAVQVATQVYCKEHPTLSTGHSNQLLKGTFAYRLLRVPAVQQELIMKLCHPSRSKRPRMVAATIEATGSNKHTYTHT